MGSELIVDPNGNEDLSWMLPCIQLAGDVYRVIEKEKSICIIDVNAINEHKEGLYYWTADNNWYEAYDIVMIRRAPWLMRFLISSRKIIATFKLRKLETPPVELAAMYRHFVRSMTVDITTGRTAKEKSAEAEKKLRACHTSLDYVQWMRDHMVYLKY